jgi:hypothetical protein
MSLNALPAELQQVVYDFDGRYKAAMARCFLIITQRRSTFLGEEMSSLAEYYINKYPEYYTEVLLRAARYQSQIKDGMIRGIDSEPFPSYFNFRDVIGVYQLGKVDHIIMINGKGYKSLPFSQTFGVSMSSCTTKSRINTVVKCIDVLEPVFQKSVKDVKEWRELGVSENGVPAEEYYKSIFGADVYLQDAEVDGKDYLLVNSRYVCRGGLIYGEVYPDSDEVVWLTDAR